MTHSTTFLLVGQLEIRFCANQLQYISVQKVLNFCLALPSQHIHENKVMRVVSRPPDQRLNLLELTQVLEMTAVVKAGSTVF